MIIFVIGNCNRFFRCMDESTEAEYILEQNVSDPNMELMFSHLSKLVERHELIFIETDEDNAKKWRKLIRHNFTQIPVEIIRVD